MHPSARIKPRSLQAKFLSMQTLLLWGCGLKRLLTVCRWSLWHQLGRPARLPHHLLHRHQHRFLTSLVLLPSITNPVRNYLFEEWQNLELKKPYGVNYFLIKTFFLSCIMSSTCWISKTFIQWCLGFRGLSQMSALLGLNFHSCMSQV